MCFSQEVERKQCSRYVVIYDQRHLSATFPLLCWDTKQRNSQVKVHLNNLDANRKLLQT